MEKAGQHFEDNSIERWRMILGQSADPESSVQLDAEAKGMDEVLEALYAPNRRGGLESSSPKVSRWLGDIRKYFPTPVVQIMQRDALQRLGLDRMLLEPELLEIVEPDIHLVGVLLSLNKVLPEQTRETARMVIKKVVDDIEKRLKSRLQESVKRALNRQSRNHRPRQQEIDWRRTIYQNLKHYQPEYQSVIPEKLSGFGRKGSGLKHILLLIDQSGSMASSVVYASVFSAALASIRAVKINIVAFDTAVVDLSEQLDDPVELLFGVQLGGGTDIAKALTYASGLVQNPQDTILCLISDLYEAGNRGKLYAQANWLKQIGVNFICLLSLDDEGAPAFDHETAAEFETMEIPVFACTPEYFPEMFAAAIEGRKVKP
jgi:Mg-chelatase subunit ChlD